MPEAHEILGVSADADEATLRARYVQLVREFPPDRVPERFAEIRAAYDELRDPVRMLERKLFHPASTDSLENLAGELRERLRSVRLPVDTLLSLAELP